MFLGTYRFDGAADDLLAAYHRLLQFVPAANLHFHACAVDPTGLWVYDACPTREVFQAFAAGEGFRLAVRAAGLPAPHVMEIGELHAAFVQGRQVIA